MMAPLDPFGDIYASFSLRPLALQRASLVAKAVLQKP